MFSSIVRSVAATLVLFLLSGCFDLKTEGNPPQAIEPPTAVYDVEEELNNPRYSSIIREAVVGYSKASGKSLGKLFPPLRIEADCSGYVQNGKCSRAGGALDWNLVGPANPSFFWWRGMADDMWEAGQDLRSGNPTEALKYMEAASKIYQFFDWTGRNEYFPSSYQSELGSVRNEIQRLRNERLAPSCDPNAPPGSMGSCPPP